MIDRPFWIFVCGTYRTASTTAYQITRDIITETDSGIGIGYHTEAKLREFDKSDNPYIACKVFEPIFKGFRGETSHGEIIHRQDRMKAIATIRNPLDIIVSMKKRSERRDKSGRLTGDWSFEETAKENFPIWLGWLTDWIDLGPELTMVSRFEEFTTNLLRETRRIASFLEIELSDDKAKAIAKRYTVQAIAERNAKKEGDDWLPSIPGIVFGSSDLWRTWLTGRERRMVEEANREFMERFNYVSK